MSGGSFDELDAARAAALAEGARFVGVLEPVLRERLRAGVQRLRVSLSDVAARIDEPALASEVDRAIDEGVGRVIERLRAPEVWLAPLTAPDLLTPERAGWSIEVPGWIARALRDRRRADDRQALGSLDDPANRIWVAVAGAAGPLDRVLEEAGFRPGRRRMGGRFGLGPRSLGELDPSGALRRCWKGYRSAYGRLIALTSEGGGHPGHGSPTRSTG